MLPSCCHPTQPLKLPHEASCTTYLICSGSWDSPGRVCSIRQLQAPQRMSWSRNHHFLLNKARRRNLLDSIWVKFVCATSVTQGYIKLSVACAAERTHVPGLRAFRASTINPAFPAQSIQVGVAVSTETVRNVYWVIDFSASGKYHFRVVTRCSSFIRLLSSRDKYSCHDGKSEGPYCQDPGREAAADTISIWPGHKNLPCMAPYALLDLMGYDGPYYIRLVGKTRW